MKIQVLSDLHRELDRSFHVAKTDADLFVLAGDIDQGVSGIEWAASEADRLGKPVVYVAGNHEHYDYCIEENERAMRQRAADLGVYFLENDGVMIDRVRFLGCTFWTNYLAAPNESQKNAMWLCKRKLEDHRRIRKGKKRFHPRDALERHEESAAWLEKELNSSSETPKVVVTHHGPSVACQNPKIRLNTMAAAFVSERDDIVEKADAWIYGHTHACLDAHIRGTRVVSNQKGYPHEKTSFENGFFIEL